MRGNSNLGRIAWPAFSAFISSVLSLSAQSYRNHPAARTFPAQPRASRVQFEQSQQVFADPQIAAAVAGLRYVSDEDTAGISRHRHGAGFTYVAPDGETVRDKALIARIRSLAIPPAWTSVWISPLANAHLAATGRDAKGRKQYRYNPEFLEIRGTAKHEHVLAFAQVLPKIRQAVSEHLALRGMPREKVLATVVALLEETLIRVGNEGYVKQNGSFGLTTLRNRHVHVAGSELRFLFHGKSGKTWKLNIRNRRVARIIRACQELPGQHLFQYQDAEGSLQKISSSDVNAYLREITGRDITAKEFRTWAGTVEAAAALHAMSADGAPPLKKHTREALEHVAARLGNTVTICRKSYVHPEIIAAYEAGALSLHIRASKQDDEPGLSPVERAVLAFLRARLKDAADA
jgi:DNA topoisomerase-1